MTVLQDSGDNSGHHDWSPTPGPGTTEHGSTPGECSAGAVARVQDSSYHLSQSLVAAPHGVLAAHSPLLSWEHWLESSAGENWRRLLLTILYHIQVLSSLFININSSCSSHGLMLLATCQLCLVIQDYILLIRGTKYTTLPSWLETWTHLRTKLFPLLLASLIVHSWLAIFLPNKSVASLPPGKINKFNK